MTRSSLRSGNDDDVLLPLDPDFPIATVSTPRESPWKPLIGLAVAGVLALLLINVVLGAPDRPDAADDAESAAPQPSAEADDANSGSEPQSGEEPTGDSLTRDTSARGGPIDPEFFGSPGRLTVVDAVPIESAMPGLAILGHTVERAFVRIDLGTGQVDELIPGDGWRFNTSAHQTNTVAGFINLSGVFVIDENGDHQPTFDEEFDVTELWPAADGRDYWGRRRREGTFVRYGTDGSTLAEVPALPDGAIFVGDTIAGFVIEAEDGASFVYDPETGESQPVGSRVLATSPTVLVVNRCETAASCETSAVTLEADPAEAVVLPIDLAVAQGFDLSPDGRLLAVDVPGGIVVYDTELGEVSGPGLLDVGRDDALSWSGGGHDLLRMSADGASIRSVEDGQWVLLDFGGLELTVQPAPVLLGPSD